MTRYELGTEFWEIAHDGPRLTISTGTIGHTGKETVRKFVSADHAHAQFIKLVGEKRATGWTLIERASIAETDTAPAFDEVHDPELEAAIAANPYDEEAFAVYADWLQARGAPRGELIALQRAEENAPDNPRFRAATLNFLAEHRLLTHGLAEHLALHGSGGPALVWRFGFIHRIDFDREMDHQHPVERLLDDVLRHASGRFVTEISIRDDRNVALRAMIETIGRHAPKALRELSIKIGGTIGSLAPVMALGLTTLTVKARSGELDSDCMRSLVQIPQTIERLEVRFRGSQRFGELAPLFQRTDLPVLRKLMLRGVHHVPKVCQALAASTWGRQLVHLDLSLSELDTTSVALLADRARFPQLKTLRLSRDHVMAKALVTLKESGLKIDNVSHDRDDIHEGEDGEPYGDIQE